ncbi:NupC/NupG family nucleoside CNT transporter [Beijerinckia sp. L45]|uniref:NupC/NupG family nucleoside CNT transporter n=1 Tax=Beijerinckia sp. L45 TaxID=1641855 RepID=UPI00131BC74C|nr:nucleoside transporter C-terminal domain-containing protein [Beijerinckia sp. L45]
MRGLVGLLVLLSIAFVLCENRRGIGWRVVIGGVLLQVGLAVLLLKFPPAIQALVLLNKSVGALQSATDAGTTLVFGFLGGGPLPYAETQPGGSFTLAFRVFPLFLVISALASLLLYWGVLQRIVGLLAGLLRWTLGIGGALGLGAAVHIFVGMVEAPLLLRPYLKTMSRGELFALMSCGMAGIAGTVMVIYGAILGKVLPDSFSSILVASVLSTPGALAVAAIMVPFRVDTTDDATLDDSARPTSSMEAIIKGTTDGVGMIASIVAMLIVLVSLVTLLNMALGLISLAGAPLTLQRIFAYGFRPLVWLIGIPWDESDVASRLMGTKTVLNEFVAVIDLSHLPDAALSPRSRLIITFALCGFANFGSLGIMLGGMSAMAPERRHELVALGWRSMIAGTLATLMSGAVVGLLS